MIADGAKVTIDDTAKNAYLYREEDALWISFDLPQTLYMKLQAAEELGLGGTMVRAGAGRRLWMLPGAMFACLERGQACAGACEGARGAPAARSPRMLPPPR